LKGPLQQNVKTNVSACFMTLRKENILKIYKTGVVRYMVQDVWTDGNITELVIFGQTTVVK
jgi:hypothetical protein